MRVLLVQRLTPLIVLLTLVPLAPLLISAFGHHWRFPDILPEAGSLRGLGFLFEHGGEVSSALGQSLVIALATTALSLLVALPAGYVLGDRHFRGPARALVILILLLPILVSPMASVMGIHTRFIALGLADTLPGVILVHLIPAVPYASLILSAAFWHRSGEPEAAARTLGAGPWRTFFVITLPDLVPSLAVAGFMAFLISWGQYLLTLVVGGGLVTTLPLLLFSAASGSDPVITGAISLLFALPALVALPFVLRFVQQGPGALKQ